MADNHKMWQELGMDVETHDLLCEALPQAFGDVFLSQTDLIRWIISIWLLQIYMAYVRQN